MKPEDVKTDMVECWRLGSTDGKSYAEDGQLRAVEEVTWTLFVTKAKEDYAAIRERIAACITEMERLELRKFECGGYIGGPSPTEDLIPSSPVPDSTEKLLREGAAAFADGYDTDGNPYEEGTTDYTWWYNGWSKAQRERAAKEKADTDAFYAEQVRDDELRGEGPGA